jgi:ligand-binding sensor domain-containing protein/signal transduction histidine kinase
MNAAPARAVVLIAPSFLLACVLLACPTASALNPSLDISQYAHTSWKIREGFSRGQINAIAQTPDGYLWLGTEFGLLRFDGIKNVPWQPPGDQHLPSNWIFSLLATRDGTLWIGTAKGLVSWKDGKLTSYKELAGPYIFKLLEDRDGTVWASGRTSPNGRLCAIQNASVRCYGEDGSLGRGAFNLYEDSKGNLWAGVKDGLWQWKPGPPKFYSLPGEADGIQGLGEDDDGTLLVGWRGGIHRFVSGKTEAFPLAKTVGQFRAIRILRDRDGGLWIGTQHQGLVHIHQGKTDVFSVADGLSGEDIYTLFEDREGSIWVATLNGLDRFRDFAVSTLTVNQGLSSVTVGSVLAATDGGVWLSTYGGLNRWNNGQLTVYRESSGRTTTAVREIVGSGLPDKGVESLFQDGRGRIWVATFGGFGFLENDRFNRVSGIPGGNILAIGEDTAGNLWLANEEFGLFRLFGGREVQQIPWASLGHRDHVSTMAADPMQGGLWLGFQLGGIAYFADGQVRATYTTAGGLGQGRVNHLRVDRNATVWAATEGGLSRLKDGRIATLTSKNGLPCDTVLWTIEDDAHSFWLYTACGLVRIARSEVDAWAAAPDQGKDAKQTIQATVFDNSDGVRSLATSGHYSPQVAKTSDGRLWFLPWDGVSVIDPRHLRINNLPPPVHIEQITADRKPYDVTAENSGSLRLPALSRDLEIDYTALSLVAPEKIRFRYKLEGYDRDWQDVGNRRQAFYTNLRPGHYTFRVIACNNNGVWNETGAALSFYIQPAFYQTYWFLLLGLLTVAALIWLLYVARLRRVAAIYKGRMEERIGERERIARDLHDTFLQSVQGLILKFDAAAKQIPPEQQARQSMENALDRADEVMAEGRERVRNLRDNILLSDLPAAFAQVAGEISNDKIAFKTVVEGRARNLNPLVVEETYAIGREAILNAFTHSGGSQVEVEVTYDRQQFRIRIRDDGRGIDPQTLQQGGRPDHFGLQGMRERANRIDAQLNLWSGAERGTEVELLVPGKTAYLVRISKPDHFWQRRSVKGE